MYPCNYLCMNGSNFLDNYFHNRLCKTLYNCCRYNSSGNGRHICRDNQSGNLQRMPTDN